MLLFIYLSILSACLYMHHVCAWCPVRSEGVLDPPRLELQMVGHHVGAGN